MIITFDDGHRGIIRSSIFQNMKLLLPYFLVALHHMITLRHFWFIDGRGLLPVTEAQKLKNRNRIDRLAAIG